MRARAERRGFAWALAASVALHALVLFSGWTPRQERLPLATPSAPVIARLAEVQIPDAPPAEVQESPKEHPKPHPKKSIPIATPTQRAKPAEEVAEPPAAAAPPASAPTASVQAPVTSVQPDRDALDATTAAQYRLQLIGAARRHAQSYPALARENNWNGNVVLEVVIHADGRAELALRRGSGHEVLDQQALDTFRRALRDVPVPPSLRGRQLALEPLVVVYALKD